MSEPSTVSQELSASVAAIRKHTAVVPRVGLVLGSGLGAFADTLGDLRKIAYGEIPHFAESKVVGHSGNLCFGTASGTSVVCMQGRVHAYEGHAQSAVVHGVRTMAKLGVRAVLITNAAGGLDPSWLPGDLMLITDHLNLTGTSPLIGINDDTLGPRFPDMSKAYDPELGAMLRAVAKQKGHALREGIYAGLMGPTYETPAEVRMLRGLGAHAVGMSTVGEVIALRHMGVRVGAMSCITNLAAGILDQPLDHSEVEATAKAKRSVLIDLLTGWIGAAGAQS
jgi:purine-nucleoside phosphorylase